MVTDSTADIPPDLAVAWRVRVVPLSVHFGDETFRDGVDITPQQFYARMSREAALPRTSQPPPALFEQAFREFVDEEQDVVSLHISGKLSGTVNAANLAAQTFPADRIRVLDTQVVSLALMLVVRHAALLAAEGATLEAVAEGAERAAAHCSLIAMIDTLENLHRGGRIGGVASLLGGLLSVKPVICLRDGIVTPLERVRTRTRALERVLQLVLEQRPFDGPLVVGHCDNLTNAEQLRASLSAALPDIEVILGDIGPVVGTHGGPGATGIGYVRQT